MFSAIPFQTRAGSLYGRTVALPEKRVMEKCRLKYEDGLKFDGVTNPTLADVLSQYFYLRNELHVSKYPNGIVIRQALDIIDPFLKEVTNNKGIKQKEFVQMVKKSREAIVKKWIPRVETQLKHLQNLRKQQKTEEVFELFFHALKSIPILLPDQCKDVAPDEIIASRSDMLFDEEDMTTQSHDTFEHIQAEVDPPNLSQSGVGILELSSRKILLPKRTISFCRHKTFKIRLRVSKTGKNMHPIKRLARASFRAKVTPRQAAVISNAVLEDYKLITATDSTMVIDQSKVIRERKRQMKNEKLKFKVGEAIAIYFDSKNSTNLNLTEETSDNEDEELPYQRPRMVNEEMNVMVKFPGAVYIGTVITEQRDATSIANEMINEVESKGGELKCLMFCIYFIYLKRGKVKYRHMRKMFRHASSIA